jgi:hypothetical protein
MLPPHCIFESLKIPRLTHGGKRQHAPPPAVLLLAVTLESVMAVSVMAPLPDMYMSTPPPTPARRHTHSLKHRLDLAILRPRRAVQSRKINTLDTHDNLNVLAAHRRPRCCLPSHWTASWCCSSSHHLRRYPWKPPHHRQPHCLLARSHAQLLELTQPALPIPNVQGVRQHKVRHIPGLHPREQLTTLLATMMSEPSRTAPTRLVQVASKGSNDGASPKKMQTPPPQAVVLPV